MKFKSINLLATFLIPCLLTLPSSPAHAEVINSIAQGIPTRGPNGEYFPSRTTGFDPNNCATTSEPGGPTSEPGGTTRGPNGEYFPSQTRGVDPNNCVPTSEPGGPTRGPGGTTRGPNREYFPGTGLVPGTGQQPLGEAIPPYIPPAQDESLRPFVLLVNGQGDCCIQNMTKVENALRGAGAEVYVIPWNSFSEPNENGSDLNDARFKTEVAEYINTGVDPNRPIILIGHSFGGDSLLKVAPLIKRRILFLGVLDPVGTLGKRDIVIKLGVPPNVDYFFNRWQSAAPWPLDLDTDGTIKNCLATQGCDDQHEQSLARKANGSEIRINCRADEFCRNRSGGNLKRIVDFLGDVIRDDYGTAAKRLLHQEVPTDEYIQQQILNKVSSLLITNQDRGRFGETSGGGEVDYGNGSVPAFNLDSESNEQF